MQSNRGTPRQRDRGSRVGKVGRAAFLRTRLQCKPQYYLYWYPERCKRIPSRTLAVTSQRPDGHTETFVMQYSARTCPVANHTHNGIFSAKPEAKNAAARRRLAPIHMLYSIFVRVAHAKHCDLTGIASAKPEAKNAASRRRRVPIHELTTAYEQRHYKCR